jgi:hypothetical protein
MSKEVLSSYGERRPLGRVAPQDRYNGERAQGWPETITFRGADFLLHEIIDDVAHYDVPAGPAGGEVIIDRKGFVIGGHDGRFNAWEVSEEELAGEE